MLDTPARSPNAPRTWRKPSALVRAGRHWSVRSALCLTLILTISSCTPRIDVKFDGVSESGKAVACAVFEPIYLDPAEIAALSRPSKVKIAAHNQTHERLCGGE
jgi:hypothetical protein